jgi:hypothetical protein
MTPETTMSKSEAARTALAEGIDSPDHAVEFIKKKLGIDMTKAQFSAVKSQENNKNGSAVPKRGPKPKMARLVHVAETIQPVVGSGVSQTWPP